MNELNNPIAMQDAFAEFIREAPKEVDGVFNQSSLFYNSELLKIIFSHYYIDGVPDEEPQPWDYDYMIHTLFTWGYFAITDTALGVLPLKCGIAGRNVFNRPSELIITNNILPEMRRTIGKDAALIKLQYNYQGVMPLVQRYSTQLAMCDSSVAVNLINSKAAIIFQAEDKKQAQTFNKIFDLISAGKPAVTIKSGLGKIGESIVFMPVKQSFVADDIMLVKRKIMNEFLTRIGVNNANLDKRERLNVPEVEANDEEVDAASQHWIKCVNEGLSVANRLFGLELSFKKREKPQEVAEDEPEQFN